MISDPISNMVAILKQASQQRRTFAYIVNTRLLQNILNILMKLGFINFYKIINSKKLCVFFKYDSHNNPALINIQRVSKLGSRIYINYKTLKAFERNNNLNNIFSILILTTPRGVLTAQEAFNFKVGGEPLLIVN